MGFFWGGVAILIAVASWIFYRVLVVWGLPNALLFYKWRSLFSEQAKK